MATDLRFEFHRVRFHFEAIEPVMFPPGKSGNIIRGAFGRSFRAVACSPDCLDTKQCERPCAYRPIFEPRAGEVDVPSGLHDPPRPFVIRAWEFDGRRIDSGAAFWFDLHLFDVRNPQFDDYKQAFTRFAEEGIGPSQAKAKLTRMERLDFGGQPAAPRPLSIDLGAVPPGRIPRLQVHYSTPTELKAEGQTVDVPDFHVLISRLRDRISTLRSMYGAGPLAIDFRGLADRARNVQIVTDDLRDREILRRSGRTGQQHSIGGFEGTVVYEGELSEFVPYLIAGRWTGVGRQTTWGKGEIRVSRPEAAASPRASAKGRSAVAPGPSQ